MKKILRVVIVTMILWVSTGAEIRFFPDEWTIQKWCLVAVDIMVDTTNQKIATTDIMIETSLDYVDFVPNKDFFPNFFPPKTGDFKIHIIGFVSNPKNVLSISGSIGRLFLKQKSLTDSDGKIQLYFDGKEKTYDSNLSILWWRDILEKTGKWLYRFVKSWECVYPTDYEIVGGFWHMSAEENLKQTMKKISVQENLARIFSSKNLLIISGICILLMITFIYYKKQKLWKTQ